ncbi:hypothetical protein LDO32_01220 [Luteimonas sp. Y-2-2-4F]|nr:hypothetical protein [Luteimonas sp. Y-2-2-4F]MCD9030357.1 hypothetical protein [Luteimonas sp. Y-2-2-4F]
MGRKTLSLLAAGLFAGLPFAVAAQECDGQLIDTRTVATPEGTRVGELQLYYDGATGRNCARTVKGGPAWGSQTTTAVSLGVCSNREDRACNHPQMGPSDPALFKTDVGVYGYHAGPVSVPAQGRCIRAAGYIDYPINGARNWAETIYGHCGG